MEKNNESINGKCDKFNEIIDEMIAYVQLLINKRNIKNESLQVSMNEPKLEVNVSMNEMKESNESFKLSMNKSLNENMENNNESNCKEMKEVEKKVTTLKRKILQDLDIKFKKKFKCEKEVPFEGLGIVEEQIHNLRESNEVLEEKCVQLDTRMQGCERVVCEVQCEQTILNERLESIKEVCESQDESFKSSMDKIFDKHFESMDKIFDKHFESMDKIFDKHFENIDKIFEKHFESMNESRNEMKESINEMKGSMNEKLEKQNEIINELKLDVKSNVNKMNESLTLSANKKNEMNESFKLNMNENFDQTNESGGKLERKVDEGFEDLKADFRRECVEPVNKLVASENCLNEKSEQKCVDLTRECSAKTEYKKQNKVSGELLEENCLQLDRGNNYDFNWVSGKLKLIKLKIIDVDSKGALLEKNLILGVGKEGKNENNCIRETDFERCRKKYSNYKGNRELVVRKLIKFGTQLNNRLNFEWKILEFGILRILWVKSYLFLLILGDIKLVAWKSRKK